MEMLVWTFDSSTQTGTTSVAQPLVQPAMSDRYRVPPGPGLGVRLTTSPRKT